MISEATLDPLLGHLPCYPHSKPNNVGLKDCIGKNPSPTYTNDSAWIVYKNRGQPSSYEIVFEAELGPNHILTQVKMSFPLFGWRESQKKMWRKVDF